MRKLVFLFVLFATFGVVARAADVTFKASAPEAVVMGETFRLSYTVNAEGKDIRVPAISHRQQSRSKALITRLTH